MISFIASKILKFKIYVANFHIPNDGSDSEEGGVYEAEDGVAIVPKSAEHQHNKNQNL